MAKDAVYRSSESYIKQQLEGVNPLDLLRRRFELDIADVLTGPTSGHKAEEIAICLCRNRDPRKVALRLKEVAQRYLDATLSTDQE